MVIDPSCSLNIELCNATPLLLLAHLNPNKYDIVWKRHVGNLGVIITIKETPVSIM